MAISGKVVRNPVVRDRVVFSSIQTKDGKKYQIVCFKEHRPASLVNAISNLSINDEITIIGKVEKNPITNETQIVIDTLDNNDQSDPDWIYSNARSTRWKAEDPIYSKEQLVDGVWVPEYF